MLSCVRWPMRRHFVLTPGGHRINTLSPATNGAQSSSSSRSKPPLLLVHGFGGGVGLWAKNLDALSQHFELHAIDLVGFGRSSRARLVARADPGGEQAEQQLVDSIEHWRQAMGLDKMVLLGHSFGGYLVGAYALRYPDRVTHLVLADPWGMVEAPLVSPLDTMPLSRRLLFGTLVK